MKKVNAPVDHNQHIYDTPDLRPSLPPRLSKLGRTGQLLCSVDMKQLRDSPISGAQNGAKMEETCEEELIQKETSCDHTQLTHDNDCKLLFNDQKIMPCPPSQCK